MVISIIGKVGETGIRILLLLRELKKAHIREISRRLEVGYSTIYRALYDLRSLGLIDEKTDGLRRFIVLTEKGKIVADKLREIEDLLRESTKKE